MADPVVVGADVVKQVADSADAGVHAAASEGKSGKSIFASKTFWANVVVGTAAYTQALPPKYAVYAGVGANILLRYLTNQPIAPLFGA